MPLSTGDRLGPYEILAPLGAGGMGEVYRARDARLKRQVAIKILPPLLAADPDRLARLQREAEVLAALNHPNIAAIYGLEESDGVKALVMELVDGPTLADRIATGPIPLDEALVRTADRRCARSRPRGTASSTATSNRPTSSSRRVGRSKSSISVSPRRCSAILRAPTSRLRRWSHARRHARWHRGVYEPGAGARAIRRQTDGRLGVRLRAV